MMKPLLDHKDPVVLARAGKALHHAHAVARWLERAGAQTRPEAL